MPGGGIPIGAPRPGPGGIPIGGPMGGLIPGGGPIIPAHRHEELVKKKNNNQAAEGTPTSILCSKISHRCQDNLH